MLHDREAVFCALRFELPADRSFDIGTSILLSNDTLRAGGSCWCRSRHRCVPIADIWEPILKRAVAADPNEFALSLLDLYARASRQSHTPSSTIEGFEARALWRSSPARVLKLKESLNLETVSDRASWPRLYRSRQSVPALEAIPLGDPAFVVSLRMWPAADTFKSSAVNALLRCFPPAGSALLAYLVERHLIPLSFIEDCKRVQHDRIRARLHNGIVTFTADLSSVRGER